MRVYLTQHGLAVLKEVDAARPLSEQGRRDIHNLAEFLGRNGVRVDRILHSGKPRAEQTACILVNVLQPSGQPLAPDGLGPKDTVQTLNAEIESWSSDTLIAGHMPLVGLRASTGCSVSTRPQGVPQMIQYGVTVLDKETTLLFGLRLVLDHLGHSDSINSMLTEY